jgi:hypothetical protein
MKTASILATLLLTAAAATAQEPRYFSDYSAHQRTDIDRAVTHFSASIQSDNEGVVESGLAHIGRLKLYYPDRQFPELEASVRMLATDGRTPAIRYRAYLVASLMDAPALFAPESTGNYATPDELFGALASRLQQTLLGGNLADHR